MLIKRIETILFVQDQKVSTEFYSKLFNRNPELDVPGMTEFRVFENGYIGLMPNNGIAKIIADNSPHPQLGTGIPRCELYLLVDDAAKAYHHAISIGAKIISPLQDRDWGDIAGYVADPDGHIIAFAETKKQQ